MTGYSTIIRLREVEEQLTKLGLTIARSRYSDSRTSAEVLAVCPLNEGLPIYSREAELFIGTLEELEVWIRGVEWARDYDKMLKISSDSKREAAEKRERIRIQKMHERKEKARTFAILSDKDEEEVEKLF